MNPQATLTASRGCSFGAVVVARDEHDRGLQALPAETRISSTPTRPGRQIQENDRGVPQPRGVYFTGVGKASGVEAASATQIAQECAISGMSSMTMAATPAFRPHRFSRMVRGSGGCRLLRRAQDHVRQSYERNKLTLHM